MNDNFKILIILLTIFSLGISCKSMQNKQKEKAKQEAEIELVGKAVYTTKWCVGARPSPKQEAEHRQKRAIRNTTLTFTNKATKQKLTCKTNELGEFKLKASKGVWEYGFSEDFRLSNKSLRGFSIPRNCEEFYSKSYGIIDLQSNTSKTLIFKLKCDPCNKSERPRP